MKIRSKTIISLTAVIAIFMNMIFFSAKNPEQEQPGLYESNFLRALQIIDIAENKLESSVTNGEFAGAAAVISGMTGDYYEDGIFERMTESGYMPPMCVYSERPITYVQAVKTLVAALGYDDEATRNGGYPNGYMLAAAGMGLLDGIKAEQSEELTWGALAKLLYNALDCNTVREDGNSYNYNGGKVMEEILHIYRAKGQVTANSITSLTEPERFRDKSVQIDGEEFECSDNRFDKFFGYNVEFWYKRYDSGSQEILYMEDDTSKSLYLDYTSEPKVSGNEILYYSNGKEKRAVIESGSCIVYNGRVTKKSLLDFSKLDMNAELMLTDTNSNGKYDIVSISEYKTIFVSKTSTYNNTVYDRYDAETRLSFDPDKAETRYIYKDTDGNDIKFTDIKSGTVMSVLMTEDGKIAESVISSKTIDATVKGYSTGGRWPVINTDTEEFKAYDFVGKHLHEMSTGTSYTLYFDKFGIVSGFAKSSDTYTNAVLLKAYQKDGDPDDAIGEVRLYNMTDKKLQVTELEKNVKVDGVLRKKSKAVIAALTENTDNLKYRVIRFKLNENGKIREIDTSRYDSAHEPEESLQLLAKSGVKSYERDSCFFYNSDGTGFVVDKTASKMFSYNTNEPDNSSEYSTVTTANLPIYESFSAVSAYTTDIKNGIAEIVMVGLDDAERNKINNTTGQSILFDSVSEVADDNNEIKYCINGWDLLKNAKYSQTVEDASKLSGCKSGDILDLNITYSGRVGDVVTVYRADSGVAFTGAMNGNGSTVVSPTNYRWLFGKAYLAGNGFMYVLRDGRESAIDKAIPSDCDVVTLKKKTPNYYIYDKTARHLEKIRQTDYKEINDYVSGGKNADNVLVYSRHSSISIVIVFR